MPDVRPSEFTALATIMEALGGLVMGKTQTHLPWDSWQKPYTDREPEVWFHEVFRSDGTPYRPEETELLKRLTSARRKAA